MSSSYLFRDWFVVAGQYEQLIFELSAPDQANAQREKYLDLRECKMAGGETLKLKSCFRLAET